VNDTDPKIAAMVARRYRQMTPEERLKLALELFDTARAVVHVSPPQSPSRQECRLALARRFYANELPEAALRAFALWPDKQSGSERQD
jgi:hypothetical protein